MSRADGDRPPALALRRRDRMVRRVFSACHDGRGDVVCHLALDSADSAAGINFLHDDVLPPGASIGEHDHRGAEETYFVAEGSGELVFDGRRMPAGPGDVSVCGPGHTHGIANTGPGPMRLLVLSIRLRGDGR